MPTTKGVTGFRGGLAYTGVNAPTPPNFIIENRAPTINDSKIFNIGDLWLHYKAGFPATGTADDIYMLVQLERNIATWVPFGAGGIKTLTGNTGGPVGPDVNDNINVVGDAITINIAGNPATNTLTASTTGIVATSFPTDLGTAIPVAGALNIITDNAGVNSGSSVLFTGVGNTVTLNITDSNNNTLIGEDAGNLALSGNDNTGIGFNCLNSITSGDENTAVGSLSLNNTTTGSSNSGLGFNVLNDLSTGDSNNAFGSQALSSLTTASSNNAFGSSALSSLLTGTLNIAIGNSAAANFTTTESSNIIIGNNGTVADNNTIRIGVHGNGAGQQISNYTAGIYQQAIDLNTQEIVVVDANSKLGSTNFSALAWTPTLSFGGASVGITYLVQEGIYQVLGNIVFYSGAIALTNKGVSVGVARVEGLPFASSGVFQTQFGLFAITVITLPVGYTYAWILNEIGTTNLIPTSSGSGVGQVLLDDTAFANNSQISFSGFYFRV